MQVIGVLSVAAVALLCGHSVESVPCCGHRRGGAFAVGALAFAGGYAIGHHRSHHHGGGGCCSPCGHCGKKRRSIESFLEDAKVQEVYEQIAAEDKDQCGLRLVCELAQKDPKDMVEDELQILMPYPASGKSDGTVYGNYDEAAWHGREGHTCSGNYPLCAFTAQQVMDEYRKYVKNNGTFVV